MSTDLQTAPTARHPRTPRTPRVPSVGIDHPVLDAGIAIGYLLVMLPGLAHSLFFADGIHALEAGAALAATSAAAGALLFRRRFPVVTLVACVVLLLVIKTLIVGFLDPLGLALAGYALAAHLPRRSAWVAVPAAVGLVVLVIVVGAPLARANLSVGVLLDLNLVFFVPACALGLVIGAVARRRRRDALPAMSTIDHS